MKKIIIMLLIVFISTNCLAVSRAYTNEQVEKIISSLKADNIQRTEIRKEDRKSEILSGSICLVLCVWGLSTGSAYGIVTGSMFGYGCYKTLKEATE